MAAGGPEHHLRSSEQVTTLRFSPNDDCGYCLLAGPGGLSISRIENYDAHKSTLTGEFVPISNLKLYGSKSPISERTSPGKISHLKDYRLDDNGIKEGNIPDTPINEINEEL